METEGSDLMDTVVSAASLCQLCGDVILDQYLLQIGQSFWHEDCVKCQTCGTQLFDRCYEKDGKLFCGSHYYRLYSPHKCCGCKEGVAPTDMVYKLKSGLLYHTACHRCFHCGRALSPGDNVVVDDSTRSVACIDHYQHMFQDRKPFERHGASDSIQQTPIPPTFPVGEMGAGGSAASLSYLQLEGYGYYGASDEYAAYGSSKYLKRRGPRTTIKQHQLDVLNKTFNATPKPSKHARAKLALETGLSMRVIQVWFQNRRSKERRLKHLCNWIRENENRGLIAPMCTLGGGGGQAGQGEPSTSALPPASELTSSSCPLPHPSQLLGCDDDDETDEEDDEFCEDFM